VFSLFDSEHMFINLFVGEEEFYNADWNVILGIEVPHTTFEFVDYVHSNKESNWDTLEAVQKSLGFKLSEEAQRHFVYMNYEVVLNMELDTKTGDTKIIGVDGRMFK